MLAPLLPSAAPSPSSSDIHPLVEIKAEFPGLTKAGKRNLARHWLHDAFKPYAHLITRKIFAKQAREANIVEYDTLLGKMRTGTDPQQIQDIMKGLEEIEARLKEEKAIAFVNHGPELQNKFLTAADFQDEFINMRPGCKLAAWYFCESGAEGCHCNTFSLSKVWLRKFDDPLATKQKYTCPRVNCWTKYRTKYGMIAEIKIHDTSYFFKTPIKQWDIIDLQAAMAEEVLNPKNATGAL